MTIDLTLCDIARGTDTDPQHPKERIVAAREAAREFYCDENWYSRWDLELPTICADLAAELRLVSDGGFHPTNRADKFRTVYRLIRGVVSRYIEIEIRLSVIRDAPLLLSVSIIDARSANRQQTVVGARATTQTDLRHTVEAAVRTFAAVTGL